jgi:GNAT superfamily N-acetyltransferase
LLDAALTRLDREVYVEVDEDGWEAGQIWSKHGFTVNRCEYAFVLSTDPAETGLAGCGLPTGFAVLSAAEADVDLLRRLDDELRQDVPGVAGWRNEPADFYAQTFESPEFDAATYLVAVEVDTGDYAGLVRVWMTERGPRLGLIGTTAGHRRQGLARALIAKAFSTLHERGDVRVTCEVDHTNTASRALMAQLGARLAGGSVELVRRPPAA